MHYQSSTIAVVGIILLKLILRREDALTITFYRSLKNSFLIPLFNNSINKNDSLPTREEPFALKKNEKFPFLIIENNEL